MPSPYIKKIYVEGGYYHVFNRGHSKAVIFHSEADFKYFIALLQFYLHPDDAHSRDLLPRHRPRQKEQDFSQRVGLVAYCLIPNHFHFLLQQRSIDDMTAFLRCLNAAYVAYHRLRHHSLGALYHSRTKARFIGELGDFLQVSRYIHYNAYDAGSDPRTYRWTNSAFMLRGQLTPWLREDLLLQHFPDGIAGYRSFLDLGLIFR